MCAHHGPSEATIALEYVDEDAYVELIAVTSWHRLAILETGDPDGHRARVVLGPDNARDIATALTAWAEEVDGP